MVAAVHRRKIVGGGVAGAASGSILKSQTASIKTFETDRDVSLADVKTQYQDRDVNINDIRDRNVQINVSRPIFETFETETTSLAGMIIVRPISITSDVGLRYTSLHGHLISCLQIIAVISVLFQ
jgi:hypothetical protein